MGRRIFCFALLALFLLVQESARAQFAPDFDGSGFGSIPAGPSNAFAVPALRLLILLAAALAGLAAGVFLSPLLAPFRLRLAIFAAIAGGLWTLVQPGLLGDIVHGLLSYYVFTLGLAIGLGFGLAKTKAAREARRQRPTSLGSAQWADADHLHQNRLLGGDGFLLGRFAAGDAAEPLLYKGDRHLLTVAPTRSGKGVSAIIPNLLAYQGSALVIDPKGENALVTAERRGAGAPSRGVSGLGQNVFIVDPWAIAAPAVGLPTARLNPLDWIKPGDPDLSENAFLLADALIPSEAQGEDRFWDEEAKALLMGVMLYVATAPEEAETRHLGRVRDIIMMGGAAFDALLERMFAHDNPIVTSTAARTAGKEPKLRANVLASVQAHTHFLDSPRMRENLSASDFSFADLKTSAMTIYLVLPADRLKTFDRWLRLLVQQAISVNARNIAQKPEKPILFMLDEMAALGRLAMVEQAFGLMAGFGMQLWGVVQDLSQLHRIYGDGWETFIANSGVLQYFGSRDRMTADYFSTLCGVATVHVFNLSEAISETVGAFFSTSSTSSGGQSYGWSSSSSRGTNQSSGETRTVSANESQRKLAYPDELMVLPKNRQILLIENFNPIAGEKIAWFKEPVLKTLGVNLHPDADELSLEFANPEPPAPAEPPAVSAMPPPRIASQIGAAAENFQEKARALAAASRDARDGLAAQAAQLASQDPIAALSDALRRNWVALAILAAGAMLWLSGVDGARLIADIVNGPPVVSLAPAPPAQTWTRAEVASQNPQQERSAFAQAKPATLAFGWLGAGFKQVDAQLAERLHMSEPRGLMVADLDIGGPAWNAGVEASDVILEFQDAPVYDAAELATRIRAAAPGTHVTLRLLRNGEEAVKTATVGTLSAMVVAAQELKLRNCPQAAPQCPEILRLYRDQRVRILEEAEGGWVKVAVADANGIETIGYVNSKFLK